MQQSDDYKTVTRQDLPGGGFKLFTRYHHAHNVPLIDVYDALGRIIQHYTGTDKCARCEYAYDDKGLKSKTFSDGRIYERNNNGELMLTPESFKAFNVPRETNKASACA